LKTRKYAKTRLSRAFWSVGDSNSFIIKVVKCPTYTKERKHRGYSRDILSFEIVGTEHCSVPTMRDESRATIFS